MSKKEHSFRFAIGAVSLLGAFVILSLLAFAMLTYTTAANDNALAEDTAAASLSYYTVRSEVEGDIAQAADLRNQGNYSAIADMGIEVTATEEGVRFYTERPIDQRRILVWDGTLAPDGTIEKKIHIKTE